MVILTPRIEEHPVFRGLVELLKHAAVHTFKQVRLFEYENVFVW